MDIKSAYRLIPVHPQDRPLLGMCWDKRVFVDNALPFGLRSAPKIFNAVADALEWIIKARGVERVYWGNPTLMHVPGVSALSCKRVMPWGASGGRQVRRASRVLDIPWHRDRFDSHGNTFTS